HRLAIAKSAQDVIAKLWQLGSGLKAQRFNDDVDAGMIEHVFGAVGKKRPAFGEPFFTVRVARIDFANFKLDRVTDLAFEIAKKNILDRLAHHAGAEQSDADFTSFDRCCHWKTF